MCRKTNNKQTKQTKTKENQTKPQKEGVAGTERPVKKPKQKSAQLLFLTSMLFFYNIIIK